VTPDAAARCPNHPNARALGACERCGTFACIDCAVWRGANFYCVKCEARTLRDASWLAIASALLGFVSIGCGPLGLVALAFGAVDLVRVKLGTAPRDSMKLAALGIGLGLVGMAITAGITWRLMNGGKVNFD
jgi:hypothetical protein